MIEQKFTSAGTSINSRNLPAAFRRFAPRGKVLDWGCGRFYRHTHEFCLSHGATEYLAYDKFNISDNLNTYSLLYGFNVDTAYCCNVLNVIAEDDIVKDIIRTVCSRLAFGGVAIFQIYEGDKTGVGRQTKKDCYQRNMRTDDYLSFFLPLPARYKYDRYYNYIVVTLKK